MFNKIGGFGLYQFLLTATYFCLNKSVMLILLSLSYLEKVPREYFCTYEGSDDPVSCKPADFCTDPKVLSYEPNMALEDSYVNWVG